MHPIHYSLILNVLVLVLAVSAGLAYAFAAPWLVIVAILAQTHALERFRRDPPQDDEEFPEQPMGFNADIK